MSERQSLLDAIDELKSFVHGEIEALEAKAKALSPGKPASKAPVRKGGRYDPLARNGKSWSLEEDTVLLGMKELGIPQSAIARGLQRTPSAVGGALHRLQKR